MRNHALFKVLFAILLAILAGWATGPNPTFVKIYGLIGQLFLNALTLVVVPLVTASIITGAARMGGEQSFGRLGAKTLGFFVLTTFLAILCGVFVFFLFSPGSGDLQAIIPTENKALELMSHSQMDSFDRFAQILLKIVPANILAAAVQGQMLGLIFFSLLFGFFITRIEAHASSVLQSFWKGIFQVMMHITQFVMKALPIGVFGLVAKVIATTGFESIQSVGIFFFTVIVGLCLFAVLVLPLLLFFVGGVNPILHFRAMAPALFTAFSTSSSAATLPITIDCVEKRAGVSNRICSFTVPLGTSMNMTGSALYQAVAVLFIAQVYGVPLTATTVAIVILMSLLTSFGLAGIPSAVLISAVITLQTIGVPVEGIALLMAVERLLDMCRTVVNVFGNASCAVLIARSEGEHDVLAATPIVSPKVNG